MKRACVFAGLAPLTLMANKLDSIESLPDCPPPQRRLQLRRI